MQDNTNSSGGVNSVVIIGRTGQDPELKYFESGKVKASFSLAVNRFVSKEKKETDWFNVEVWDRPAEIVGEYLKKGNEVAVAGRLAVRKWTDEAGNTREWLSVHANDVRFLGSRRDAENNTGSYRNTTNQDSQRAPF